jgi:hypothetical protein
MPNLILHEIRQYGWKSAWNRFVKRRHLQALAYVLLAAFAVFGFKQERDYNRAQRHALAVNFYRSQVTTCESGNTIRVSLRQILNDELTQTPLLVKTGAVPKAAAKVRTQFLRRYIGFLGDRNCARISQKILK